MINLSVGPNHKETWNLLCEFISNYLAGIIEERYVSFFHLCDVSGDVGDLRYNPAFLRALVLDHLFPDDFPQEDAIDVFLAVYSTLRADKIYRFESPVMQMVLFRLLSFQIMSSLDKHLSGRINLPEKTKQALTDAYASDYDRKVDGLEDPHVIGKKEYVNRHVAYYEELGNYVELLFDEPEFLLIDNVTKEDIFRNPHFYRGFTTGSDPFVIGLALIDTSCIRRMISVRRDAFPFVFLD